MTMYSICTAFAAEGQLDTMLQGLSLAEEGFTAEKGVLSRRFFQCRMQPHIIWALTEWVSEKHHNDAAQSLMGSRRDDRIASIAFGPAPYFEIFCAEVEELRRGEFDDRVRFVVIGRGLVSQRARQRLLRLRRERWAELGSDVPSWLRVFENTYHRDDFVVFMGFHDEEAYARNRRMGHLWLEEYLFTGLRSPTGMSALAGYNQFVCAPLQIGAA